MPRSIVFAAMLVSIAGSAVAAPPLVGAKPEGADWRDAWLVNRNRLLETNPGMEYDPTSVIVGFTADADPNDVSLVLDFARGLVIESWDEFVPGMAHVKIEGTVDGAINEISVFGAALGIVEFVEPDYILRAEATPNDTNYSRLWGLHNTGQTVNGDPGVANADIDAPQAWDVYTGNANFAVAVIDTGIRRTHTDLTANIWTNTGEVAGDGIDNDGNGKIDDTWGWNFYSNNNNPADDNGHGTHCAGTIGAVGNNASGVVGVNWRCKMAALKFLGANGTGSTSGAVSAISYAYARGIKVSNNSWTGPSSNALRNIVSSARTMGHLLVCAAGNNGRNNDTTPSYPASYTFDNVISVAAIDNNNNLASFSNYGVTSVDLGAPGVNVYSTYGSGDSSYAYLNGTSMATPHVAGVAALVWGNNGALRYYNVRSKILSTVKPLSSLSGRCATGGCLNANNAIR